MKKAIARISLLLVGCLAQKPDRSFEKFVEEKRAWSIETFGTIEERGPLGPIKHLQKECLEVIEHPHDILEYVDCIFLILDAAMRAGFSWKQILEACWTKLAINKARKWKKTSSNEPVFHQK